METYRVSYELALYFTVMYLYIAFMKTTGGENAQKSIQDKLSVRQLRVEVYAYRSWHDTIHHVTDVMACGRCKAL